MKRAILTGLVTLALSGCASSPDYRPAGHGASGYREQMLEANRYRIEYRTDTTEIGKAQDYALLRAAELTLENGYPTFVIVSRSTDVAREERSAPEFGLEESVSYSRSCGLLSCRTTATPTYETFITDAPIARHTATAWLEIVMSSAPSDGSPNSYMAASVSRSIPRR